MLMPTFNYDLAGTVLVDAAYMGDKEAAQKNGVSTRSIRRWRERLECDPLLAASVRKKKTLADQEWASELPSAIRAAIRFIRESAKESKVGDPKATAVISEALAILAEVAMTRQIIDARLAGQDRQTNQET